VIDSVVFDLDGTLWDTSATCAVGWNRVLHRHGIPFRPITEHDPQWREAEIEVDEVEKGPRKRRVVVRFPGSDDVRWYRAPKFQPGQEGVFILQKATEQPAIGARRGRAVAAAAKGVDTFTALDPDGAEPTEAAPVEIAAAEPDE